MTAPKLALWNVSRSTGSGIEVARGDAGQMQTSAERRNATAAAQGMTDTVFIAIPPGRRPGLADLPPPPPPPPPPAAPRLLAGICREARVAASGVRPFTERAALAEQAVQDAYDLGRAEATAEYRKSLAQAWTAWLELAMSTGALRDVLDLEPALRSRFLLFLEGKKGG